MKIRKMTVSDIDTVIEIGSKAPELAVSEASLFWSEKRLKPWVEANVDIMLVAEDNGEVVGFILTQLHIPSSVCYLSDIAVSDSSRNKGVATALMEETLQRLKPIGITLVYGLTQANNTKIQSLLAKEGYDKGEELYWFEKRLG